MKNEHSNTSIFPMVAFCAVIVVAFVAALFGAKSGEIAGALGSVLGGAIGAGGAAFSVYYLLTLQRTEEVEKATRAILAEITIFSKYIIGHLGLCALIKQGKPFPPDIFLADFDTPSVVIYPAVASSVSRLPNSTRVVYFYTLLAETKNLAAFIVNSSPNEETVTPHEIQEMADLLISQCQLARAILRSAEPSINSESMSTDVLRMKMISALEQQIEQARTVFPDADSFKSPMA